MTKQEFERTYMYKQNVMTYEQYLDMEAHTANLYKQETVTEFNKNFVAVADYNKTRGWTND
jgi:hypothetical protein